MSPWVGKSMDRKAARRRVAETPAECGCCGALATWAPGRGMCGEDGITITARCGNNLFVPTLTIADAVKHWNSYGRNLGCPKSKGKKR